MSRTVDVTLSRALCLGHASAGAAIVLAADLLGACAGMPGPQMLQASPGACVNLVVEAYGHPRLVPAGVDAEAFFGRLAERRILVAFERTGERAYRVTVPEAGACGCTDCRRERGEEVPPPPAPPPCDCPRCTARRAAAN